MDRQAQRADGGGSGGSASAITSSACATMVIASHSVSATMPSATLLARGFVVRSLVSLRAFVVPSALRTSWRPSQQAACHPSDRAAPARQLHSAAWRCRAAAAAQSADDLSLNAVRRRQQELQARIDDAVKVCCASRRRPGHASRGRLHLAASAARRHQLCCQAWQADSQVPYRAWANCRWPTCPPSSGGWPSWRRRRRRQTFGSRAAARCGWRPPCVAAALQGGRRYLPT